MSYPGQGYNSYGGRREGGYNENERGYGGEYARGDSWGEPPQGPPPGGDRYGPPAGPPPGRQFGDDYNRSMVPPPVDDYSRPSYESNTEYGGRENSNRRREESYGNRREESYGGRREESYSRRNEENYGERREEAYGGRREESYGGRNEESYGGRNEESYGGRREDNYGGRNEDNYGGRREDNYGGRREDSYNKREDIYEERREDNYGGRREDNYGGRREDNYGRESSEYGGGEHKKHGHKEKTNHEEYKYGRNEGSDYRRDGEDVYGGGRKNENEYGREENEGYNSHSNKTSNSYGSNYENDNKYGRNNNNNNSNNVGGYGNNNSNNNGGSGSSGAESFGGKVPYGGSEAHFSAPPNEPQSFGVDGYNFQYSACTGRRKALLIGINYIGSKQQLKGCINDVKNIKQFLQQHGYSEEDMVVLTDDLGPQSQPTRANMLRGMQWLVKDAKPNDSYFFHYSGHGGLTPDESGDEDSGFDDVIYPVDFEKEGPILDDEIHEIMVRKLPQGARLTALFDCCNSGTALDLPYFYSTKGLIKEPNVLKEAGEGLFSAYQMYESGNIQGVVSQVTNVFNRVRRGNEGYENAKKTKTSPSDVVMFSGCKDDQTSADTFADGQATGAMSHAFVKIMNGTPNQSYLTLLQNLRKLLEEGNYSQKPQLSSSHPIDVNLKFIF